MNPRAEAEKQLAEFNTSIAKLEQMLDAAIATLIEDESLAASIENDISDLLNKANGQVAKLADEFRDFEIIHHDDADEQQLAKIEQQLQSLSQKIATYEKFPKSTTADLESSQQFDDAKNQRIANYKARLIEMAEASKKLLYEKLTHIDEIKTDLEEQLEARSASVFTQLKSALTLDAASDLLNKAEEKQETLDRLLALVTRLPESIKKEIEAELATNASKLAALNNESKNYFQAHYDKFKTSHSEYEKKRREHLPQSEKINADINEYISAARSEIENTLGQIVAEIRAASETAQLSPVSAKIEALNKKWIESTEEKLQQEDTFASLVKMRNEYHPHFTKALHYNDAVRAHINDINKLLTEQEKLETRIHEEFKKIPPKKSEQSTTPPQPRLNARKFNASQSQNTNIPLVSTPNTPTATVNTSAPSHHHSKNEENESNQVRPAAGRQGLPTLIIGKEPTSPQASEALDISEISESSEIIDNSDNADAILERQLNKAGEPISESLQHELAAVNQEEAPPPGAALIIGSDPLPSPKSDPIFTLLKTQRLSAPTEATAMSTLLDPVNKPQQATKFLIEKAATSPKDAKTPILDDSAVVVPTLASVTTNNIVSSKNNSNPSRFNFGIEPPTTPQLMLTPADRNLLADHYNKWSNLALYSEHEAPLKNSITERYNYILHENISKSPWTSDDKMRRFLDHEATFNTTKPLGSILQFGTHCEVVRADEIKKALQSIHEGNFTHSAANALISERFNHSNPAQDKARVTELDLGNNLKAAIVEGYKKSNDKYNFTSESYLPKNLDQEEQALRSWARAAVTSFLAAAPPDTKAVSFEDGLTAKQLKVLISYCDFKGYAYSVGNMQKIRLFADKLNDQIPANALKKLQNKKAVSLAPDLVTKLLATINKEYWPDWLKTPAFQNPHKDWQDWCFKNPHDLIPSLGVVRHHKLTRKLTDFPEMKPEHAPPLNKLTL